MPMMNYGSDVESSVGSSRTPNGASDLLDDAFGAGEDPHYAAPPRPASATTNPYDDDADESSAANDSESENFAERTSQIVSEYRDYLQDLDKRDENYSVFAAEDASAVTGHIDNGPSSGKGGVSWMNDALRLPSGGNADDGLEPIEEDRQVGSWPQYPGLDVDSARGDDDFSGTARGPYRNITALCRERKFRVCVFSAVAVASFFAMLVAVATGGRAPGLFDAKTAPGSPAEVGGVDAVRPPSPAPVITDQQSLLPDDVSSDIYIRPPTTEEHYQAEIKAAKNNKHEPAEPAPVLETGGHGGGKNPDLPEGAEADFNADHTSYANPNLVSRWYKPLWFTRSTGWKGENYMDAVKFCGGQAGNRFPCPYGAYCPDGPGQPPLKGVRGSEDQYQWGAMIETSDGKHGVPGEFWVGVGPEGTCYHKSEMHGLEPLTEETTRYLMCCSEPEDDEGAGGEDGAEKDDAKQVPKEEPQAAAAVVEDQNENPFALYPDAEEVMNDYRPLWFHRDEGWNGMTFVEASHYCQEIMPGGELCPYEALCPSGSGRTPYPLDMPVMEGEQWAPTSHPPNTWVLVGIQDLSTNPAGNICKRYSALHGGMQAQWGLTGERTEIKEHILCCAPPKGEDDVREGGADGGEEVPEEEPQAAAVVEETHNESPLRENAEAQQVMHDYHPLWFHRDEGWNGMTFVEASAYCQEIMPGGELCPYNALCPSGPGQTPYPLDLPVMEGEQWAPTSHPLNTWVLVSEEAGNICERYSALHGGRQAEWGLTGERTEIKEHILCCAPPKGDSE